MASDESSIRILVVEDDALTQRLLQLQLRARGYSIHVCSDGREGLEAAKQLRPDVVVLDLMLPGLDGFQLLEQIRESDGLRQLPVLILTASLDEAHRKRGLSHRADAYLTKPYEESTLHETIQSLLQGV